MHSAYPGIVADIRDLLSKGHRSPEASVDLASSVSCPQCGYTFPSNQSRLFGVLSPLQAKVLIGLIIVGVIAVAFANI